MLALSMLVSTARGHNPESLAGHGKADPKLLRSIKADWRKLSWDAHIVTFITLHFNSVSGIFSNLDVSGNNKRGMCKNKSSNRSYG